VSREVQGATSHLGQLPRGRSVAGSLGVVINAVNSRLHCSEFGNGFSNLSHAWADMNGHPWTEGLGDLSI
jgi:hypothetical protein